MTPEQRQIVEEKLGDGSVICDRCGATFAAYSDQCTAALDDPCPGFIAVEKALGNETDYLIKQYEERQAARSVSDCDHLFESIPGQPGQRCQRCGKTLEQLEAQISDNAGDSKGEK